MSVFEISKANPVRFIQKSEVGGINEGTVFEENQFYNESPICSYETPVYYHSWCCDDEIRFQFRFDDTGDPIVRVHDHATGDVVLELPCILNDALNGVYDCEIIGNEEGLCNGCYYFTIASEDRTFIEEANIFEDGDDGTMESDIFGILTDASNTIVQTAAQAHTGTKSAQVTAGATPTGDIHKIMQSLQAQDYKAGRIYTLSAWIYLETANQYLVAGDIGIRTSHIPNITILNETKWTFNVDPLDQWHKLEVVFKTTGTATAGNFRIEADSKTSVDNQNQPAVFIDDIVVQCEDYILEAQSETIQLLDCEDNCLQCTKLIEYYSDNAAFGLSFAQGQRFKLRVQMIVAEPQFKTTSKTFTFSNSVTKKLYSEIRKNIKFETGWMPYYMHEVLNFAVQNDFVIVDGINFVMQSDYKLQHVDEYSLSRGSGEFIYQNYPNNKNSNC